MRKVNGVRYLDWLTEIGEVKETEIRVSKNLVNAEKEINTIDTYTRLIPLGARIESDDSSATDASEQRITIASVNNGKDYIDDLEAQKKFGIIEGFIIFDEVTQPSILKSKGEAEIKSTSLVRSSNIITALDLSTIGKDIDSFEVGNYYPVVNPAISNELVRVIEKRGDINEPHKASLTIGDKTIRASQYQAEANQSKRLVKNLKESQARQVQRLAVISNNLNSLQTMTETEIAEIRQEISNLNIGSIENELNQILDLIANINLRLGNLEADSGWISVELGGGVTNSNLFIRNKHGTIFFKGSAVFPLASSVVKLANLNGFSTLENRTIEPKLIGQGTDRAQLTIRTDNTIYLEFSTAASKRYSFDSVVYSL